METQEIETIFNQTFRGLSLFYRDTNLSEKLISKYQIGQILTERGFIDMSYKSGGLVENLRYMIASSHAKNVASVNPQAARFGHVILNANSYFKVIDVYKNGEQTQISLLEIPATNVDFFANETSTYEIELIQKVRLNFENNLQILPVRELLSDEWKEGTESPIGMNTKGAFYYDEDKKIALEKENPQKKPWWKFW